MRATAAARRPIAFRAWGATDKGGVRPNNEDCFAIDLDNTLCIVADGMGGHNAGEVAARLAVEVVRNAVRRTCLVPKPGTKHRPEMGDHLRRAVQVANARVYEMAATSPRYSGMGTTIVAAVVRHGAVSVAQVGDSRLYLFDGHHLRQLTSDDSLLATVLASDPDADPMLLQRHPFRHALTNVVGTRSGIDVRVIQEPLRGGELIVLTTDGVHGTLDHDHMKAILVASPEPADAASKLVRAALAHGSHDNCTAVVAEYLG
jgi:protein phosphatase